ncbi:MAG TPA: YidB family protein [Propionicimonas sp.]|jgi:uncharacterized protein YidB (DUF937 family)
MDELLKGLAGGGQGPSGQGQPGQAGGIGDLLGGLLGGGGLGSILGAGVGAGVGNSMGGGMGSILGGGLGALLPTLLPALLGMLGGKSGAGGGSGMHQLVDTMHAKGMGDVAGSWVGTGASQPITAAQVEQLLSPGQLAQLAAESGLPPDQVSQGVAAVLPDIVSTLTPGGTLPDPAQVQATTDQLRTALAGLPGGQP